MKRKKKKKKDKDKDRDKTDERKDFDINDLVMAAVKRFCIKLLFNPI